jgi:hypothetical protein
VVPEISRVARLTVAVAAALALVAAVCPAAAHAAEPYAAEIEPGSVPIFRAGSHRDVPVVVWNRGTAPWSSTPGVGGVFVSYHWRAPDGTAAVWDGLRTALPGTIAPGDPRGFVLDVLAPPPGQYVLELAMVREGAAWFGSASTAVTVYAETYLAAFGPGPLGAGAPGTTVALSTTVKNIGSAAWGAAGTNPVRVSYHWYDKNGGVLVWDGVRTPLVRDLVPGESQTVRMSVALPAAIGVYQLRFDLVREGEFWFGDVGSLVSFQLEGVPSGLLPQLRSDVPSQLSLRRGDTRSVTFTVRNLGTRIWSASGPSPVRLSYHLYGPGGVVVLWDGARAALPHDVLPNDEVVLSLPLVAPAEPGGYIVKYDLVWEGVAWFETISPKAPLAAGSVVVE